jgi:EAL domain-containing protein (putative c-di-GMP-specific phosphodiesterase class I)
LRWQHPEYGPLAPDQVIPLAEQTGLIKPLTLWVLEHAVQQSVRWRQQGIELNIAVNLSVYNLQDSEFASHLQQLLARYKVPPRLISLEITESAMMADPARAKEILSYLDEMGVWLSVDDFGTGFSSLSHLKQLPVDELKIDKSFVMTMIEDDNDAVIVRSTIDLAHNLGLKVVAEGVENLEIWNLLEILRCDAAQGYYLSHPLSADQLQEWLASREIEPRTAIGKDS